ncbi:protein TIFY 6b-like [Lolium rigidum]|uniref:protein TIFY 6b-like n=1 Tax=Lolium rigidum TaxID=89674 RepID=UPI001F5CFA35|nr:protein TIFY 6b-like [Lolium rigidum]
MERDFMGAAGQRQQQRADDDDGGRKETAYFGAGGPPPMDWSFASRADAGAGAAPGVMSFRSAPRADQGLTQFSAAQKQQASRALTHQRSFGAESHGSPQYTAAMRDAYGGPASQQQLQQQQRQQHHHHQQHAATNGARVIPGSSPNNPMFKVQSSPSLPNGVAAGGTFKQPPFTMNSTAAVAPSRVGVYARNMPKPKMAQLTIFYAGSVNVFNNVSPEKAQELMMLASRGSLPGAPAAVTRSPETSFFVPAKVAAPEVSHSQEANLFAPAKFAAPEVSLTKQMLPQQRFSPPASGVSRPISSVSQASCLPKSASSSNIDSAVPKFPTQFVMPLASQPPSTRPSSGQSVAPPTSQHQPARPVTLSSSGQPVMPLASQPPPTRPVTLAAATVAAIMPRAVPQARKASLARFLEKRKERVTTVSPYPSAKSPIESSDTVGSSIENNKSSCTGIAMSSSHDKSVWRPRNISFGGESPSTNLHI